MTTQEQVSRAEATHERPHPGPGEYIKVALVLAVVTAVEVGAYYVTEIPDGVLAATLLVMMAIKFALVALWFMHLRFDSPVFRRLFVGGIVLAFLVYAVAFATIGLQATTIRSILRFFRNLAGG
jgi:caa(3)-type oxidase subunit IV